MSAQPLPQRPIDILLVEDSPADRLLTAGALSEARVANRLHVVEDGEDALRFVRQESPHANAPRPDLILLDLNLPRLDGRAVLRELKADPLTREIPVIVLTTSNAPQDVEAAYAAFANSYVQKPVRYGDFADAIRVIEDYWFQLVTLPLPSPHIEDASPVSTPPARSKLVFLVIEDTPADAHILREHLSRAYPDAGSEVHSARRVSEAEAIAKHRRIDVVLTDLNLPDSAGIDTVVRVRRLQPDAAVIVLTGSAHDTKGREAIRAGADDYLLKDDVSMRAIRRSVEHAQERRHLQTQVQTAARHRLLARLAGYVAHDFNNLLTVIRAETHALLDQGVDAAAIEGTLEAARRGEQLTRRLLAHGRQQPLNPRPGDIASLLNGQTRLLQRLLGPTIETAFEVTEGLPPAEVDPVALEFMLYNLTTNARDAMPKGGRLSVTARAVDDQVEVAVADTGHGMSPDRLEQVAEPFFSTKGTKLGSGLGLSSVRETMQAHGGAMLLESEEGAGTVVRLRFRQSSQPAPHSDAAPRPEAEGKGATILVIDDERAVRRAVSRVLARAGFEVHAAANGEEARATARQGGIDLVLSDLVLGPEEHGVTIVNELRHEGYGGPVLFMSGYANEFGGTKLIPGRNFIQKPYDPEDLLRLIRRALATSATVSA